MLTVLNAACFWFFVTLAAVTLAGLVLGIDVEDADGLDLED